VRQKSANQTLETNRRPASPLDDGREFARALCAPPFVSGGGRSALRSAASRKAIANRFAHLVNMAIQLPSRVRLLLLLILTLFPLIGKAQGLEVLYSFGAMNSYGHLPYAGVTEGADGCFYGTTTGGGSSANYGTVFKLTTYGVLTTLASFDHAAGLTPVGTLALASDGNFYGNTLGGDSSSANGTIFRVSTNGLLTTLVRFDGTNGIYPCSGLIPGNGGDLYGTTAFSIRSGGTVFRVTTNGNLTTLVTFNGDNGKSPRGRLTLGDDGALYGTTFYGGISNMGTVFRVTTNGALTTLFKFAGTNGACPQAYLTPGSDGSYYGTTTGGGSNHGTLFRITTNGLLTTLVMFSGTNGDSPQGGLCLGADGNFYGTTAFGGTSNMGTVFKLTTNGALTTLVNFAGSNGEQPRAELTLGKDGRFYGTTALGGSFGVGTVFRLEVPAPPCTFQSIIANDGVVSLTWSTVAGRTYQLQYKDDLGGVKWLDLGEVVRATNFVTSALDFSATNQRFYRIRVQ